MFWQATLFIIICILFYLTFFGFRSTHLVSLYSREEKNFEKMQLVGKWDWHKLNPNNNQVFHTTPLINFHGKTLKATSFEYKPYTYSVDKKMNGKPSYDGVEVLNLIEYDYDIADIHSIYNSIIHAMYIYNI